jgi:hypothetical protein
MEQSLLQQLSKHENPSIRYMYLTGYEGRAESDPEVIAVKQTVKGSPIIDKMLSPRTENGALPYHAYAKWRGAYWTLLQLVDLGYPSGDASLIPLFDQCFDWLLEPARLKKIPLMDGRYRRCALQESGTVFSAVRLGSIDTNVEQLVELLLKWQWPDGGWNCDKKPPAHHSSFYESLIPLRGMNAYALATGDPRVKHSVERVVELFLSHRLYKRSSTGEVISEHFTKLAFPPYWRYDILAALIGINEAGHLEDPRCQDALDLLESKMLPGGGIAAEVKYFVTNQNAPSIVSPLNWGPANPKIQNDYLTARALGILKKAGRI